MCTKQVVDYRTSRKDDYQRKLISTAASWRLCYSQQKHFRFLPFSTARKSPFTNSIDILTGSTDFFTPILFRVLFKKMIDGMIKLLIEILKKSL
jgi:hypothetical protein